jgi:hypothetical protein
VVFEHKHRCTLGPGHKAHKAHKAQDDTRGGVGTVRRLMRLSLCLLPSLIAGFGVGVHGVETGQG